jgi:hypothetical protein
MCLEVRINEDENGGTEIQDSVLKFDTEADKWSSLAPMHRGSDEHSTSVYKGLVYIVGAVNGHEVFRFDSVFGVWSTLAPTMRNRQSGTSFVLSGSLYAAGGCKPSSISSVERHDVASDTRTALADFSQGRCSCCAVTIGYPGSAVEQDRFDSLIAKATSVGRVRVSCYLCGKCATNE